MASPIHVLIVEDNLAHQKITEYGLKRSSIPIAVTVVRDGQEVLDYLYLQGKFSDPQKNPRPGLILLDLNLPKRDGREVLGIIKQDSKLKDIPVVIVSTSDRVEDIGYAFEHGAVAYISKSSGFDKFNQDLSTVTKYARQSSTL